MLGKRAWDHNAVDLDDQGAEARSRRIAAEPRPRCGLKASRHFQTPAAKLGLRQIDREGRVGRSRAEVVESGAVGLGTEVQMAFKRQRRIAAHRHVDVAG